MSHAYLFSGPSQIGKFYLAKIFSQSVLCESVDNKPCKKCKSCQQIEKNISSNYIIIEKESEKQNISIKQIREMQQKISLKSFDIKNKIIIINNSEGLSEEAANALLKTLEEPYPHIIFILITKSLHLLPKTIKSRCQIYNFNQLPKYLIENWLILKGTDKKDAKVISGISIGKPGTALEYSQDINLLIDQKEKTKIFFEILKAKHISDKLKLIGIYLEKTTNANNIINLLDNWELLVRDYILISHQNSNISNLVFISVLKKIANLDNQKKFINYCKLIKDAKLLIKSSVNPKLVLENLILQI